MTTNNQSRQTWSSRLTYVLTVAGATVGFGATWRFPYLVGENGGGAYVLLFCIAMIVIGIPMILVENVIGGHACVCIPLMPLATKSKIKVKTSPNIGKLSVIWGFLVHLVSWPIIWCLVVGGAVLAKAESSLNLSNT